MLSFLSEARGWARGDYSRLPTLATDLVSRRVNVISVNRPGGNVTGFALETDLMDPKRLGLLRDLAPGVLLFGALVNPNYPPVMRQLQQLEDAARAINQRLFIAKASTDPELDAAFASLKREGAGALLIAADAYFDTRRDRIVGFASQQRLPAIYHFREYAVVPREVPTAWVVQERLCPEDDAPREAPPPTVHNTVVSFGSGQCLQTPVGRLEIPKAGDFSAIPE